MAGTDEFQEELEKTEKSEVNSYTAASASFQQLDAIGDENEQLDPLETFHKQSPQGSTRESLLPK